MCRKIRGKIPSGVRRDVASRGADAVMVSKAVQGLVPTGEGTQRRCGSGAGALDEVQCKFGAALCSSTGQMLLHLRARAVTGAHIFSRMSAYTS